MTRWAAFLWLTAVVAVLLLALARLSSAVVRDEGVREAPAPPGPERLRPASNSPPSAARASAHAEEPVLPTEPVERDGAPTSPERDGEPTAIERDGEATAVEPADEPPGDPALGGAPATAPHRADAADAVVPDEPERIELSTWTLLANVALTQGLVGLAIVTGLWWFEIPGSAIGVTADPWIGGLPAVAVGLAFGLALWLGNETAAGLADAVGAAYDEAVRSMLAPNSRAGWAVLLGLVLPTVAVVEELLFRGAMIGVPAAGFGISPWLLAVVSSVAFALGHGAQGRMGIVVTGVLGFVLAAGYVLTGSLVVAIVAHYVVNAMEFVVHEGLGLDRLVDL